MPGTIPGGDALIVGGSQSTATDPRNEWKYWKLHQNTNHDEKTIDSEENPWHLRCVLVCSQSQGANRGM